MAETITECAEISKVCRQKGKTNRTNSGEPQRNLEIFLTGSQDLHNSSLHQKGSIFVFLFSTSFSLLPHLSGS